MFFRPDNRHEVGLDRRDGSEALKASPDTVAPAATPEDPSTAASEELSLNVHSASTSARAMPAPKTRVSKNISVFFIVFLRRYGVPPLGGYSA